jgi:hypothetical protein
MEFDEINQKLTSSLNQVLIDDCYLLEHDISERSISHRLAVYLESQFLGFNVDCEYNGNIDADNGRKYICILKEMAENLHLVDVGAEVEEFYYRCVYPDIIIHRRGKNDDNNNLLIIEIKKSSNPDPGNWDEEKLLRFTSLDYENDFNYHFGAFVRLFIGKEPYYIVKWYQNGNQLSQFDYVDR